MGEHRCAGLLLGGLLAFALYSTAGASGGRNLDKLADKEWDQEVVERWTTSPQKLKELRDIGQTVTGFKILPRAQQAEVLHRIAMANELAKDPDHLKKLVAIGVSIEHFRGMSFADMQKTVARLKDVNLNPVPDESEDSD